jgi:phage/conjugal plasmid C-4 type zinc finger TraR family protein
MDIADFANKCMEEFNTEAMTSVLRHSSLQSPSDAPRRHCLECQSPIPVERLRVVPGCRLCVECADQNERRATLFAGANHQTNTSPSAGERENL